MPGTGPGMTNDTQQSEREAGATRSSLRQLDRSPVRRCLSLGFSALIKGSAMHHISRRNFVLSATAASAAFGLDGPLEFIGSAQAQSYANTKLVDKGFHKFKVGNVEVTQIYDGIWNRNLEDGFVKNAPADQVKATLKGAGLA